MKGVVLLAACAALPLFAQEQAPTRLDVSAEPAGAVVWVDGVKRGTAPCSLFDVKPGRRRVRLEAPGYWSADEYVSVAEGAFTRSSFMLEEENALMLLRTDPADAEVLLDGVMLGRTPLLVTSLPTGRDYAFDFRLTGYLPLRIEMKPRGRTPVVREEKLVADSGALVCTSDPSGAEILVNGVSRGTTPVSLDSVPKGDVKITCRLAGWREETRAVRLSPGETSRLAFTLKGLPASLTVVTTPDGAKVFVDDAFQGKTPLENLTVDPGERKIRIECEGFAPVTRTVTLANGTSKTENIQLANILGRLEITTMPAGARITLEGKSVGSTVARPGAAENARSAVFAVENVEAGERTVRVRMPGYAEVTRKVPVNAKETTTLNIALKRVYTPDTIVETVRGTYRGVLIYSGSEGLRLETSPGVERFFPTADIRRLEAIPLK